MGNKTAPDYQVIFNAMPGFFLVLQPYSPHYTILAISDELLATTSMKREEVVGKSIFGAFPENPDATTATGSTNLKKSLQNAIQYKKPDQMPVVRHDVPDADGVFRKRYWSSINKPVLDEKGEVIYILLTTADVTQQVKAEKAKRTLRKFEKTHKLFLQAPIALNIVTGPENVVKVANERALRLLNKSSDIIGKPLVQAAPELKDQEIVVILDRVRKTGEPHHATEHPVTWDVNGQEALHYFDITYQPYYDSPSDKMPSGVFTMALDVTEHVAAKKQLEDKKQYLQNAIEIANLGTFKIDVGTNTGSYSEKVASWFGLEGLSQPMDAIITKVHPDDAGMVIDSLSRSLESKANSTHDITYRVISGSRKRPLHLRSIGKAFFADGEPHAIIGIIQEVTPQINAQQKLKDSEQQIRALVESSPFAIGVYIGREMRIQYANQTMLDAYGKGNDIFGRLYAEVLPELDPKILQRLDEVFVTGVPFHARNESIELVMHGKRQPFYYNYSFTPLFDASGKVYGVMNTAADVTDLVLARNIIEESTKELRSLANAMPQVVWIAEANGEVTYYNDRISAFAGAKKLTDGSWHWESIVAEEDLPATLEAWKSAVLQGTVYEQEHRIQMKDGSRRWHLSRAYPQRDETGTIVKWYGTATDVQEQKANEEALRRSEEQLRIAVEAAELGTFSLYPETNKLVWPAKTKEMFGLPPESEANTAFFLDCIYPDDREHFSATVQKAMQPENGGLYENEFRIINFADNKIRWMRSKGKVSFNAEGKAIRLSGVTQDITGQRQAAEALQRKNVQLIHINNDLDNFIYTASHDLKAPISNIEGLLSLLSEGHYTGSAQEDEAQKIVRMMQESVNRFKKTIDSLTDVVKLQQDNSSEDVVVDLHEIVKEVKLDLGPMIKAHDVELETDMSGCGAIRFSEKNLRSVIYNLLSNAIKYRSPERTPWVLISCESTPNYHVLTVKDNGLGMRQGSTDQLFTMFKRFHDHVEGTGIGLYMVKKIMENAGGHIEVESQVGVGTTFKVYFVR